MLLWIDSETNDPKTENELRKDYPELEISYLSTYKDAEMYLGRHSRDIEEREKFIIICRGYYASESKNYLDIAQLFSVCNSIRTYLGVYTRSRANLLEKAPNPPKGVEIFEKRGDLLAFVNRRLKE
jgi:hypothetical protein